MALNANVYIINQDIVASNLIKQSLKLIGLNAYDFTSPENLFAEASISSPACFLMDFTLPEMSGLEVMSRLRQKGFYQPCIFMSVKSVPELLITAMNNGAFGFLKRPFIQEQMIEMVQKAIKKDTKQSFYIDTCKKYNAVINLLTKREKEVVTLLFKQMSSRAIAQFLKISQRTVENHRRNIYQKLRVKDAGDLIRYQAIKEVLEGFDVYLS